MTAYALKSSDAIIVMRIKLMKHEQEEKYVTESLSTKPRLHISLVLDSSKQSTIPSSALSSRPSSRFINIFV
jgi:hypothetical protein